MTESTSPTTAQLARFLLSTLTNSLDGVIVYEALRDATGQIIDFTIVGFNPAGKRTAGLPADRFFEGQQLLTAYPAGQTIFNNYVSVVETGQPFRFDYQYQITGIWYQLTATKLGDGLFVMIRDISTQRKAEAEVARQQQAADEQNSHLRATLDASLNGIVAMAAIRNEGGKITDFRITMVNTAFGRLTNTTADKAIGNTLLTLFP